MKHLFRRVTSLVLALALTLSLCCVTSFAVEADLEYAHFEVGTFEAASLEAGDIVRIPLSIVGMEDGQYCGGFGATITLGDGLEWYGNNTQNAEWTELVSSFGYKFINPDKNLLTAADVYASSNNETSFQGSGKVCDILCRVTEAYDGTNATIALSSVSITGTKAADCLNSADGTNTNKDTGAIIFAGAKVTENTPISAVIVQDVTVPEYTIVAETNPKEAVAGDDITVTVTVKGGEYVAAAVKLSYDSDVLTLKSAGEGWDEIEDGYCYYNVKDSGVFDADTVIGTFVFTAKALDAETITTIDLDESYVEATLADGSSNVPANLVENTDATVTIKQDELVVTVPEMDSIIYDGQDHAFEAVTAEGAAITYSETEDGDYSATIPTKKDADTYTLYYKAEKLGCTPASGSYTMTIVPRDVTITVPAQGKTFGQDDPDLTYTVGNLVENETFNTEIKREIGETVGEYAITVTPTPGGNPNYNVTSNPGGTFTISAATIEGYTVDWNEITVYNGQENPAATVTTSEDATEGVTTTWKVNDVETEGIPNIKDAGTYEVTYTISKDNYTPVTNSYTFTINSGVVEAAAENVEVEYDGQPHSITVTVTKPQGSTISYRTSEEADWSTENPSFTNVTETPATVYWKVSKVGYTDAEGSATVTIKAKDVTITPNSASKTYGEDDPTLDGTVSGLLPGDDLGVTYTRETGGDVKEGGYTITASYTPNANYNVTCSTGVFTIYPKAVTINVNDKNITLGDELPAFDGSIEGLVNENDLGTVTYTCEDYKQEVGTYEITASYTENPNYTVTVNNGTLTVSNPTYEVEVIGEYVAGYHMILVYTNDVTTFSYDGKAMYDVTSAGYKYEETTAYNHVYAIVVPGEPEDVEEDLKAKAAADMTTVAAVLTCDTLDVNSSSSVDLRDAVAVVAVYNANETYMTSYMPIVLKADVNHDKLVDAKDFGLIKAEYMK